MTFFVHVTRHSFSQKLIQPFCLCLIIKTDLQLIKVTFYDDGDNKDNNSDNDGSDNNDDNNFKEYSDMITIIDNNYNYNNHEIYDDKDDGDNSESNHDAIMNAQITRWIYMEGF